MDAGMLSYVFRRELRNSSRPFYIDFDSVFVTVPLAFWYVTQLVTNAPELVALLPPLDHLLRSVLFKNELILPEVFDRSALFVHRMHLDFR
jgi:hypothetical protein